MGYENRGFIDIVITTVVSSSFPKSVAVIVIVDAATFATLEMTISAVASIIDPSTTKNTNSHQIRPWDASRPMTSLNSKSISHFPAKDRATELASP